MEDVNPVDDEVEVLQEEEVRRAIKGLKNCKSGGLDGIVGEMVKYGGDELLAHMWDIYRRVWETEEMPEDWGMGLYVPLHKKEDRATCDNYRGVCLLNIGYKIQARIMCNRLMPWYLAVVGNYQAGFMPGKSTVDNVFIIRQINEKFHEYAKTSWHIFVDYKQAYDSVHRPSLWNMLREFNIPEKLVRLVKMCYSNSRGRVRVGGDMTDEFGVNTGLRQGCPLSCMLFNMALEWVMRNTPPSPDPITLSNGLTLDRLAYADDCDLMGEGYRGRDEQLYNFDETGQRAGLEVKEGKTKAMKMSRQNRTEDFIDLGGFMLEEVDQFKYLGSIIQSVNSMESEISSRIAAASKCSWAVNDVLKSKSISRATKIQLYTTVIRPVLTYSCETWPLTQELERRLLVFEHGILRRIYGPVRDALTGEWRIRHNQELRDLSRLTPVTGFVRAQRLRWAGHVARMDADALPRRVLEGEPLRRRPPGRPKLRWRDCVRRDLELLDVPYPEMWMEHAQDRTWWRLLVAAAKGPDGLQLQE